MNRKNIWVEIIWNITEPKVCVKVKLMKNAGMYNISRVVKTTTTAESEINYYNPTCEYFKIKSKGNFH